MSEYVQQQIIASDGHKLVGRFFIPYYGVIKGSVLIVPAMGVGQRYYAPFATWLMTHGFLAVTFDYRGTGLSRSGTLQGFTADIFDWAQLDCAAVITTVLARVSDRPLYWIGHSLGGQILPLVPNREQISKVVTIATGSGYWRENSPRLRRTIWWLWYVVAPLAVRLFGYFPGKRLRKIGDLPRGVMEQWRTWCLNPEYAVGAEGEELRALYASVNTPIVSLSFTDDEFMSANNIESIHSFYRGAPKVMKRIRPKDIGAPYIGHFGFFRPAFEQSLWAKYLLPELRENSTV